MKTSILSCKSQFVFLFAIVFTLLWFGCVSIQPSGEMYVGSYERVPVKILGSGISYDDLEFRVVGGPAGGIISESRDAAFDYAQPTTMLIAGYKPGKYTMEAVNTATSKVVATADFEVHTRSPAGKLGPSLAVQGMNAPRETGAAWGGGPSGPQNMNMNTSTGTRNLAIILVDTDEERFPTSATDMNTIRDRWMDNIMNGTNIGGVNYSLRDFYRQGSNNRMDVAAQMFGPYQLDGNWNEVGAGAGLGDHAQAAITAADDDINYNNFNSVLVVSQSVGAVGAAGAKYAWPSASIGEWSGWTSAEGNLTMGAIQMPVDWTARDGRQIYATASHEMGHNLGHPDTYTPAVPGRNPGGWDLMDAEANLPNFNLPYRMRLGWVDSDWIKCYNFAGASLPVDETITLRPLASGDPGLNKYVGAEIRISDGYNYYFEYRTRDAGRIADRTLPINDRVLGVDAWSGSHTPPYLRPPVLLLPNGPDSDGPVLANGDGYFEDVTPVEFHADVSGINGTEADLRIRYGVFGKPDPQLEEWGAPPWQSPSIEVRNARNAVNPDWANVPWEGNTNEVIAKVKNGGDLDAPGVVVNFFVKDFTIADAPEFPIGNDTKDIPRGATVEFTTNWTPPGTGHYCIIARIPLYTRPGTPPVVEQTELNNLAQSNYTRFISATASPAIRQMAKVMVTNPYDKKTRIYVSPEQTNPYYRTYIEHKWLMLEPDERAEIEVMFEYVGELPPNLQDISDEFLVNPNVVNIAGLAVNPHDDRRHQKLSGGVTVEVATGRATEFNDFQVEDNHANGSVVTTDDGKAVNGGTIILTGYPASAGEDNPVNQVESINTGQFSFPLEIDVQRVKAYYLAPRGLGDAESEIVDVKRE